METARRWLDSVEPFLLPILKLLGPIAVRYALTTFLARRRKGRLTRRQYLLIWSAVFAARVQLHRRRRRAQNVTAAAAVGG
jgi:hypothetical protein